MKTLRDHMLALPLLLLGLLAFTACAGGEDAPGEEATESEMEESGSEMASEEGQMGLPLGFAMRLDHDDADPEEFHVMMEGEEIRVQTGPAGILYRETDRVESGDYSVSATFVEYEAPAEHREAFGIFVGGQDLEGEGQSYAYFLVRADGSYLVKSRQGSETSTAVSWTESDAVNMQEEEGTNLENMLAVSVAGDVATFSVNGTEVASVSAEELGVGLHGAVGMRVNHRLDVGVRDWSVVRGM